MERKCHLLPTMHYFPTLFLCYPVVFIFYTFLHISSLRERSLRDRSSCALYDLAGPLLLVFAASHSVMSTCIHVLMCSHVYMHCVYARLSCLLRLHRASVLAADSFLFIILLQGPRYSPP